MPLLDGPPAGDEHVHRDERASTRGVHKLGPGADPFDCRKVANRCTPRAPEHGRSAQQKNFSTVPPGHEHSDLGGDIRGRMRK